MKFRRVSSIVRTLSTILLSLLLIAVNSKPVLVGALSEEQRKVFDSGVDYFDVDVSNGSSCATNLAGNDNPEKVWNYLISKGMSSTQAAGAMGNLQHEGGFNPSIVERGHMEGDKWVNQAPLQFPEEMDTLPPYDLAPIVSGKYAGQPGYGIVQWTSPNRKQGLADFAASKGLAVNDLGLQLDYMWSELEGPYKTTALDPLMATDDLAEAVRIWQDNYEVGANFQPRMDAAQEWLTKFGSNAAPSTGGGCGGIAANGCPNDPISASDTVTVAGIQVHPCISAEVERIVNLANQQGLDMSGGGYRDSQGQIETRKSNCGTSNYDIYEKPPGDCSPPTARPGDSRHESGTAVDFTCGGELFTSRSHPCYTFLEQNTSLINLPSEPWHWSDNGE